MLESTKVKLCLKWIFKIAMNYFCPLHFAELSIMRTKRKVSFTIKCLKGHSWVFGRLLLPPPFKSAEYLFIKIRRIWLFSVSDHNTVLTKFHLRSLILITTSTDLYLCNLIILYSGRHWDSENDWVCSSRSHSLDSNIISIICQSSFSFDSSTLHL